VVNVDDKGVSEIVGEMLILSIVVILAAILSANILGLLPSFEDIPYASFVGVNGSNLTIIHEGGDSIPLSELRIMIDDGSVIQCDFSGPDLYCNEAKVGSLGDDGNDRWDFGECLTIYRDRIGGEKIKITIAHERQVLCKLFFGW